MAAHAVHAHHFAHAEAKLAHWTPIEARLRVAMREQCVAARRLQRAAKLALFALVDGRDTGVPKRTWKNKYLFIMKIIFILK